MIPIVVVVSILVSNVFVLYMSYSAWTHEGSEEEKRMGKRSAVFLVFFVFTSAAYHLSEELGITLGGEKLEAMVVFAAMTASFSFHVAERDLHNLPGIPNIAPFGEQALLFWDRVLAVTLAILMGYRLWKKRFPYVPWIAITAILFTVISELGKYGFLTGDKAVWWNRHIYPILHSVWHVLIFLAAYRAVKTKGREKE